MLDIIFFPLLYPQEASGRCFGFAFAMPLPPCVEIFGVNALRGKLHQLGSPNLQDIFMGVGGGGGGGGGWCQLLWD